MEFRSNFCILFHAFPSNKSKCILADTCHCVSAVINFFLSIDTIDVACQQVAKSTLGAFDENNTFFVRVFISFFIHNGLWHDIWGSCSIFHFCNSVGGMKEKSLAEIDEGHMSQGVCRGQKRVYRDSFSSRFMEGAHC